MRNRRRVRGIRDNDGGDRRLMTGPRNLRRRWRRRRRKMSAKNSTTTAYASTEDRQHVQRIIENDGDGSGSMMGSMDWKLRRSVYFPCYPVADSNNVSSLFRCCLVLILFSSDPFFPVHCRKDYQYCYHAEKCFHQV